MREFVKRKTKTTPIETKTTPIESKTTPIVLYIPKALSITTVEYVRTKFEELELGTIDHIEMIEYVLHGSTFRRFDIYYSSYSKEPHALQLMAQMMQNKQLLKEGKQIPVDEIPRIVHGVNSRGHDNYWEVFVVNTNIQTPTHIRIKSNTFTPRKSTLSETPIESKMAYEPGMTYTRKIRSETPIESKINYERPHGPPVIPFGFIRPPVIPQKTVTHSKMYKPIRKSTLGVSELVGGMRTRRKIRVIKCKPKLKL